MAVYEDPEWTRLHSGPYQIAERDNDLFSLGSYNLIATEIPVAGTSPIFNDTIPESPVISLQGLLCNGLIKSLERTGKNLGFDSSIVPDFFEERQEQLVPLFEKSGSIDTLDSLPLSDEDFAGIFTRALKAMIKTNFMFRGFVGNKQGNKECSTIKWRKIIDLLSKIEAFEYVKSSLA
ncbi:hypothetical protein KY361_03100 [Candidatus Woesearchaeota archaeon]|nr:hypothetical protein [Candidatus Woesearchaeota archaeon]